MPCPGILRADSFPISLSTEKRDGARWQSDCPVTTDYVRCLISQENATQDNRVEMYRHKISMILFLFLITTPAFSWAWQGQVVGVSGGDSVTVLHDGRNEKIRLYGIYCPEHQQDFSQKAKEFTSKMVFGKIIEVRPMATDRYGRTVGIVNIGEKSLNEELVKAGLAWVYMQNCKESFCSRWKKFQDDARRAKLGLWCDPNPTPPWDRSKKKSKEANYLHGDTVTHVFHAPGCEKYNCRNCIVPFKTKDQAIRAGYKPCELCNP